MNGLREEVNGLQLLPHNVMLQQIDERSRTKGLTMGTQSFSQRISFAQEIRRAKHSTFEICESITSLFFSAFLMGGMVVNPAHGQLNNEN